jgi:hypothetical protein
VEVLVILLEDLVGDLLLMDVAMVLLEREEVTLVEVEHQVAVNLVVLVDLSIQEHPQIIMREVQEQPLVQE